MADYEQILSDQKDGVLTLTLNRPDRLNAWTDVMHNELKHAIVTASRDDAVRVIVVTGAWNDPAAGEQIAMTAYAFASVFPWYPAILSISAVLFAFSTMISWSYYGEQCWEYLFGKSSVMIYKIMFLLFCWAGAVFNAASVIDFGDLMILGMAFPNILGVVMLSGAIRADLDRYLEKLRNGEFRLWN